MFIGNTEEVLNWFSNNIKNVRVDKYDLKEEDGYLGRFNRKTIYIDYSGIRKQEVVERVITNDTELSIIFNSGLQITFVKEGDEVNINLIYFNHDKKRLQYKLEMIHKTKKYLSSTIEILALYVDLGQRKVAEFEEEKTKIMDDFINKNKDQFKSENLKFSNKLKK